MDIFRLYDHYVGEVPKRKINGIEESYEQWLERKLTKAIKTIQEIRLQNSLDLKPKKDEYNKD